MNVSNTPTQNKRELEERVKAANDIIQGLENKIKQLSKVGDNLPAEIQRMREATIGEMLNDAV